MDLIENSFVPTAPSCPNVSMQDDRFDQIPSAFFSRLSSAFYKAVEVFAPCWEEIPPIVHNSSNLLSLIATCKKMIDGFWLTLAKTNVSSPTGNFLFRRLLLVGSLFNLAFQNRIRAFPGTSLV